MKSKIFIPVLILISCVGCVSQRSIKGIYLSSGKNYPEQALVLYTNGECEDFYQSIRRVVTGRWKIVGDTVFTYPRYFSDPGYRGGEYYNPKDNRQHWIWPQKFLIKNNRVLIDKTDYATLPPPYKTDTVFTLIYKKMSVSDDKKREREFHRNNEFEIKDVYLDKFRDKKSK